MTDTIDQAFEMVPAGWRLTLDRYIMSDDPAPNERTWRAWLKKLAGDIDGDGPCFIHKVFATGATPAEAVSNAAEKAISLDASHVSQQGE
jgi:hypothetical protein